MSENYYNKMPKLWKDLPEYRMDSLEDHKENCIYLNEYITVEVSRCVDEGWSLVKYKGILAKMHTGYSGHYEG